ncbi:DoxX family protein [Actinomycetospora sp. CA-084318]|uniref:DoxX family protein n=1 Tax=Actinomycetospora sp. CA-084318 TaxID=3239892 RepID=UPI003D972DBF
MRIAFWVIAVLLAVFYLYAGGLKLVRTRGQLAPTMAWVDVVPMPAVRALGVVEVLGALGLLLPALTGIAPALTVAAAVGLVVLQVLATALHLSRHEVRDLWLNGLLLVLAGLAAVLAGSS